jgi:cation-transporting ATPase E
LTIGIPAFFLALAPNSERARSGFVNRVMRRAIPAGIVVGGATLVTYLMVRDEAGATAERSGTAALVTLFLIAIWVLAVVARPYEWWKIILIAAMTLAFPLCLLVPFTRDFFALSIGDPKGLLVGVICGLAGMLLVEALWRINRLRPDR